MQSTNSRVMKIKLVAVWEWVGHFDVAEDRMVYRRPDMKNPY